MCITPVFPPVSYTHLDVYKRQVYERADVVRSVRAGCTLFTAETTVDTDLPIMRG